MGYPPDVVSSSVRRSLSLAGDQQGGWADWPVNIGVPSASTSPELGLQAQAVRPGYLPGLNSGIHSCMASTFPTQQQAPALTFINSLKGHIFTVFIYVFTYE